MIPPVLLVTGTDTGVGKTVTTAALAAALTAAGRTVAVYKPVQAGTEEGEGDTDVVRRLAGLDSVHEGIRLPEAMAPVAAAARAGVALPGPQVHRARIRELAARHDHVLVEGAGGLLVPLDAAGHTLADLAVGAPVLVVCRAGLGTLNHTALTCEALAHRDLALHGLVIGSWPDRPTEVELGNREELAPLAGALPEGAGHLPSERFRASAPSWFRRSTDLPAPAGGRSGGSSAS